MWKRLQSRRNRDRELDDELQVHLRMAIADRIANGEDPTDAGQSARREFGNQLLVKETTRAMWGSATLERFAHDLTYVFRQMRRSPGFTTVAILTLALGLGATTAIFSIVNGVLLQPLKYRDPNRLYLARSVPPAWAKLDRDFPVNGRHYHLWRTQCRSCEEVSLTQFADLTLVGAGDPVRLPALRVSSNFFKTLGVQPSLGRDFRPEEELPGPTGAVVILTDALWRSRFAADPSIIGRTLQINGELWTVVGVMPPTLNLPQGNQWGGFFGPSAAPLIFRPLGLNTSQMSPTGSLNYTSVIRLKPGVRAQQATDELNALLADFVREFHLETKTALFPLQQQVTRGARSALWLLLAAVGAVLLIVCVNVGNLMLVRTTSRYREAGIRMALGASRAEMFGMVLKEALVLVAIGGGLGLLVAHVGLRLFVAAAPVGLPRLQEVQTDWQVLAFAAIAIVFSTIACGLIPAWRVSRIEPNDSLKSGAATATEAGGKLRLREIMVSVEVALSTVLLIAGGLLMVSFFRLMKVDKGFEVAHVITQDVSFLNPKYAKGYRRQFVTDMLPKLEQIPGVRAAGAINQLPLRGEDWVDGLRDADDLATSQDSFLANFRWVSANYFTAMGIPLKQGRFLDDSDRNLPKAVISERAAQTLWPNQNPIGKHVRGGGGNKPPLEVVGIVGEVPTDGLEREPRMIVYEHFWRMQPIGMAFVLRTQADPTSAIQALRAILSKADPEMAITPARTMEQILDETVATRKFEMYLAVAFALAALILASLGIYGVISFAVARRTSEMGIRIALGAGTFQILTMVVRQGMLPVIIGLAAGLGGALLISRLIRSQLYGVTPNDPLTMSAVAILLLTVALGACWIPARRATRIDPLHALRFE